MIAAFAGLLGTSVIWGSAVPANVVILRELDPIVLTTARMVISIFVLAALVRFRERGAVFPAGLTATRFLLLGLYMGGFNIFYVLAVLWSNPITVSAITVTMPLVGSLTARVLLGTPLGRGFAIGLALSIGGGVLVVHGQPNFNAAALGLRGGEILMLIAMVCWNVYSVKAQSWLSGVGNLLWNFGVSIVGVPVASLYINLSAVFTVLMVMGLGIYPTVEQIIGGLIIVAGVLYVQIIKLRAAPAAKPLATQPPKPVAK